MGRLLQAARASAAQWERTIVLLTSDHGWKLGEHGAWSKHTLFEADTRVPLIVRLPAAAAPAAGGGALPRGVVARGVVELIDVMPSLLELVGIKPPAQQHAVKCRPGGATARCAGLRALASRGGLSRLPAALRTRHEQLLRRSGPEGRAAVRP